MGTRALRGLGIHQALQEGVQSLVRLQPGQAGVRQAGSRKAGRQAGRKHVGM